MNDLMSDGAKTGTEGLPEWAINAAEKALLRLARHNAAVAAGVAGKSYIVAQIIEDECPLTEALKVADDALDALDHAQHWIRENGKNGASAPFRTVVAGGRAALERIRKP